MTALEPGASDVLTVGPTVSPRATAFLASKPAPTITVGLEVFVHEVIAAIATDPVRMDPRTAPIRRPIAGYGSSAIESGSGAAESASCSRSPPRAYEGGSLAGNESADATSTTPSIGPGPPAHRPVRQVRSGSSPRKSSLSASSGTRSCGRRGPATDGTTDARSSSRSASKSRDDARITPEALLLRVAFDQGHAIVGTPRQPEVSERLVIDREERGRRPELGAHVADRRSIGERQAGQAIAGEFDEGADDTISAQLLGHDQDEVSGGRTLRQLTVKTHADDPRHRHVERLAEQHGLGLDPADAVAQNTEPIDHRRVRVGPDERVRERNAAALIGAIGDDRGQVLQVDLVDDPGSRWDDPQALESGLGPAQQLVALTISLVLALDVEGERARCPESVDLHRVVDDEVSRHQWIDLGRIAAKVGDGVSHSSQVDDRGHAGEVLEDDPGRHERDLRIGLATWPPPGEDLDVGRTSPGPGRRAAERSRAGCATLPARDRRRADRPRPPVGNSQETPARGSSWRPNGS